MSFKKNLIPKNSLNFFLLVKSFFSPVILNGRKKCFENQGRRDFGRRKRTVRKKERKRGELREEKKLRGE